MDDQEKKLKYYWKILIFVVLMWFGVGGYIGLRFSIQDLITNYKLYSKGIVVEGVVLKKHEEEASFFEKLLGYDEEFGDYYGLKYSFNIEQITITNETSIDESIWLSVEEGGQIKIIYVPENPEYNKPHAQFFDSSPLFKILGDVFAIGFFSIIFGIVTLGIFGVIIKKAINKVKNYRRIQKEKVNESSGVKMKKLGRRVIILGTLVFLVGLTDFFYLPRYKETALIYIGTLFTLAGIMIIAFSMYIGQKNINKSADGSVKKGTGNVGEEKMEAAKLKNLRGKISNLPNGEKSD